MPLITWASLLTASDPTHKEDSRPTRNFVAGRRLAPDPSVPRLLFPQVSLFLLSILSAAFITIFKMTYYGDHAPQLAGATITLAILAYITFGLRVYTRLRNGSFGVDDWCMAAATVSDCSPLSIPTQCTNGPDPLHCVDCCMHWWCIPWYWCSPVQVG